jgi:hypothetical protein
MKILYGGVGHPQHAYVLPVPLGYGFEDLVRHSCGMYPGCRGRVMSAIRLSFRGQCGAEKIHLINDNLFVLREELNPRLIFFIVATFRYGSKKTEKE